MSAKPIRIRLTPGVIGSTVEVDGARVTGVRSIHVSASVRRNGSAMRPARVTLVLIAPGGVEIDGEAQVNQREEVEP